jgi:hypothetical protein
MICAAAAPASAAGILRPGEERKSEAADTGAQLNVVALQVFPQFRLEVATHSASGTNRAMRGAAEV